MSTNTTDLGIRLSFYHLFSKYDYTIQIPIIQRDYTQGLDRYREVRDRFLEALDSYLDEGRPSRDLDFIYGSLQEVGGRKLFIPLDGQQRLTTLFLLHWYLAQLVEETLRDRVIQVLQTKEGTSRFSYETRSSSREFCDALLTYHPQLTTGRRKVSERIQDEAWYLRSWSYDPTIVAMLEMLDAIDRRFRDKKHYLELLIRDEEPIVTFFFLNLTAFDLTDDLYVKMNARGLQLTAFESFKALYEDYLKEKHPDRADYFAQRIDKEWTDLFWQYRNERNKFDDELMHFIHAIFLGGYVERSIGDEKYYSLDILKDLLERSLCSFRGYRENVLTDGETCTEVLIGALDALYNQSDRIRHYLSEKDVTYYDEEAVFKRVIGGQIKNYSERVQFYAYINYLVRYREVALEGLHDWMRLVHNLTHPDNAPLDAPDTFAQRIRAIHALLPHAADIIAHLARTRELKGFASWQAKEELIKAQLIHRSEEWRQLIEPVEKNPYFTGQIGFLLEYVGLITYYDEHDRRCDWSDEEDEHYRAEFDKFAQRARAIFSQPYEERNKPADFLFERAVLAKSKGEYPLWGTVWRRNLLSSTASGNIKRDYSWKRLLRITENSREAKAGRKAVREVLASCDPVRPEETLARICEEAPKTWVYPFVKEPALMKYCKVGFIADRGQASVFLLSTTQMNGKHAELYSYYIYTLLQQRCPAVAEHFPGWDCSYRNQRDSSSTCGVVFKYQEKYKLLLHVDIAQKCYACSISANTNSGEMDLRLREVLERQGFAYDDQKEWYSLACPEKGSGESLYLGEDGQLPERVIEWMKGVCTELEHGLSGSAG